MTKTKPTVWSHHNYEDAPHAIEDLLFGVWRWQPKSEPPITRYALAVVLLELGRELRGRADGDLMVEWLGQRYVDWAGYLNAPKDVPSQWEPPRRPQLSRWRRVWLALRGKDLPR
jgi:hypothetical protein